MMELGKMGLGIGLRVVAASLFVRVILQGSKKPNEKKKKPNENRHLSKTSIKISPKKIVSSKFKFHQIQIFFFYQGNCKHMDMVFLLVLGFDLIFVAKNALI